VKLVDSSGKKKRKSER